MKTAERKNASKTCPLCGKKIKREAVGCSKHYHILKGNTGTSYSCIQCGKQNKRRGKSFATPPKFCNKRCHGEYLRVHSTDQERVNQRIAMNEVYRAKIATGWHPCKGRRVNENQRASLRIGWELGKLKNKGSLASYPAIHYAIRKIKGKATMCEWCGEKRKLITWANISGEYHRDPNDYIALCRSCHWAFDKKDPKRPERHFVVKHYPNGGIAYLRHLTKKI